MTLTPRSNCCSSSSQNSASTRRLNGHWDIVERQVLNDETVGRGGRLVCAEAGLDSHWRPGDGTVDQSDGLGGRHVNAQSTVVDGNALVNPLPIEAADNGCPAVVEYQVAHCVLLIADSSTNRATVEGHISEESSGAYEVISQNIKTHYGVVTSGSAVHTVLDEKTDLVISRRCAHRNLDVLQACCLGCRPVDTIDFGRRSWNRCHVELEVAYLPVEDVG